MQISTGAARSWPVEVIAHRGASALAPENTPAAVSLAWELGADAVEIDVQLSSDGQAVVIHDSTLERTAGLPDAVNSLTGAELAEVDVGSWFGQHWADERIVNLETVIATVPPRRRLFAELKCRTSAGVDSVIDALTSPLEAVAHSPEKVVLIGFDLDLMTRVKAEFPQHEVCLVAEQKSPEPTLWLPSIEEIVAAAVSARLDGVSLANTPAVGRPAVDCIHEAGLNCCIWTVSLVEDARRFIDAGVDSLTMDDPRLLEAAD